jgi:hypothetical protein
MLRTSLRISAERVVGVDTAACQVLGGPACWDCCAGDSVGLHTSQGRVVGDDIGLCCAVQAFGGNGGLTLPWKRQGLFSSTASQLPGLRVPVGSRRHHTSFSFIIFIGPIAAVSPVSQQCRNSSPACIATAPGCLACKSCATYVTHTNTHT